MSKSHVLIVAVDGLRASVLGAYGNTSYPTPALDQFAAESLLLDACFAPSVDLAAIYRALWYSWHPLRNAAADSAKGPAQSLPRLLSDHGFSTTLIADESLFEVAGASDFAAAVATSSSISDGFAAASEIITQIKSATSPEPRLIWLHTCGLYGPWNAPLELQQSLLDEGDPPPVDVAEPPDMLLADRDDPDTAFRYSCAYAAQVMVLDECWNGLMAAIDEVGGADEWLVVLVGVRGFPLGEHARVGGIDARLYTEQLHVPCLLRFPHGRGRLSRSSHLTSHLDLLPTLAEWMAEQGAGSKEQGKSQILSSRFTVLAPRSSEGLSLLPLVDHPNPVWRDALLSSSDTARAIRTPFWTSRRDENVELYVRPDDRWEANDVASRCPDDAAELEQLLADAAQRIERGDSLPAVADVPAPG